MVEDLELNQQALVSFLQALAVTIDAMDAPQIPTGTSADFLSVLDGVLGEIANMAEVDGAAGIDEAVQVLRGNLDIALKQAKYAKWNYDHRN